MAGAAFRELNKEPWLIATPAGKLKAKMLSPVTKAKVIHSRNLPPPPGTIPLVPPISTPPIPPLPQVGSSSFVSRSLTAPAGSGAQAGPSKPTWYSVQMAKASSSTSTRHLPPVAQAIATPSSARHCHTMSSLS